MTSDQRTIIRAEHGKEKPYFMMLRKTAQDSDLSFEARGVISYLLSKPPNWEINMSNLRYEGGVGRDKMYNIIDELVDAGYMEKEQPHGTGGQFLPNVYILREEPLTEKPSTVSPSTVSPSTVNPHQHIIESLDSKESTLPDATAPASATFPPGTLSIDDIMAELNIIQAELDATPLDEIIPDPPEETCSICGSSDAPVWLGYAYRCNEHDPNKKTKPKRKRSEKQLALDGMIEAIADAFGLPHDKVTDTKWNEFRRTGSQLLKVGATPESMAPLHAWCKAKSWTDFTSIAMAKEYAAFQIARAKVPAEPTEQHASHAGRAALMGVTDD